MKIYLKPAAGLCNRMRAIDSGLALSRTLKVPLEIYWVRDRNLNCPFHFLFEPIQDPLVNLHECVIRPLRFVPTYQYFYKYFRLLGLNKYAFSMRENERILGMAFPEDFSKSLTVESFSRFYPNELYYNDFRPVKDIRKRIAERITDFDQHMVGVHIRRSDNKKSIAHSPDQAFVAQMQKELEAEPNTRFYLATDSFEVKRTFSERFGDRVLTTPLAATRSTVEGVQEAVVELYALAATRKILGSYWSSYSTTAADIGRIPMVRVTGDR